MTTPPGLQLPPRRPLYHPIGLGCLFWLLAALLLYLALAWMLIPGWYPWRS